MKKLLLLLLALVTVITVLTLTSCGHECAYTVELTDQSTPATCLKSGVKVMKCFECENTKNEIIPVLGHDYVSTTIEPTCKTEGYTTQACSRCGDTNGDAKLDKKPPTGQHTYVPVENSTVQATCTVNGYSLERCSCGQEKKVNIVTAPGHNYQEMNIYINDIAPTCTTRSEGVTTKKCTVCNEKDPSFTEVSKQFPALGHDIERTDAYRVSTVAATCTTAQHDVWKCTRCDYEEEADIGTALGHDYTVDLGVSSPATCATLEKRTYQCSRNGQTGCTGTSEQGEVTVERSIQNSYTAHSAGVAATCVDAQVCTTCVAAGRAVLSTTCNKTDANCTNCSSSNRVHVFADPTGLHDYQNYDQDGNPVANTYKAAQAVSTTAPTCMRQGYTVYRCTVCEGNNFKDNYTAIVSTNHAVSDTPLGSAVPETCIKHEFTIHACTNTAEDGTACSYTEEKIIGTTYADHQFADGEPTGVITCTYCQKSFYDTTYVESKYNDGETEWDNEETEFDDDTNLNVTITVSKSNADPMKLTNNEKKTQVDAEHADTTKISVIRIVTADEDATFVITVNGATINHTGNGFIDLCEYGDITELAVESTSLTGDATVYFYGEDPVPDTTNV